MRKVGIRSFSIISALGIGTKSTLESLQEGRSGIVMCSGLSGLDFGIGEVPLGLVPASQQELESIVGSQISRTTALGRMALRECIQNANLQAEDLQGMAFINGTTVGGMDVTERIYEQIANGQGSEAMLRAHSCGGTTDSIANWAGKFKYVTTVSTACSSGANAIILAAMLIESGRYDRVIAGGAEAITRFHVRGFDGLKVMDSASCRPFAENRNGMNLGEGAAYLLLEAVEDDYQGLQLSGYGNSCDAYHMTATSPDGEGPYLAMQKALQSAGLKAEQIDYINAHGTGTENNDTTERKAMERLFKPLPVFNSTKSLTGHTTSAAGAIEAVISLMALQENFIPLCPKEGKEELRYVMSNSFGFGGQTSSLIFSK